MAHSSAPGEVDRKKINLMSIVESLHPASFWEPPSNSSDEPSNVNPKRNDSPRPITPAASSSETGSFMNLEEDVVDSGESLGRGDDILENLLSLINALSSKNKFQNLSQDVQGPTEDDESVLQMQHPPEGKKAGIQALFQSYANGTSDVKAILNNDVHFLYECKRCRGIFRSLQNLIRHKKEYCKNTGFLSSFMNRPTNSTQVEDDSFRTFMDTLYPPEPSVYSVQTPISNPAENGGMKSAVAVSISNLKPVKVNIVQMKSSSAMSTSLSHTFTNSNSGQVIPVPVARPVTMTSSSQSNVKYLVSSTVNPTEVATKIKPVSGEQLSVLVPSSAVVPLAKDICPICDKSFAGKKNVRRHLINVHRVSHAEAVSLLSSFNAKKKHQSQPSAKSGVKLMDLCVESIKLSPNQVIHVLPQNVQLSSSSCPVCGRQLCRKANVRRHLVESHKMVIKNDKKYWKLRELANTNISNSSSPRALRYLLSADASNKIGASTARPAQTMKAINISKPLSILPRAAVTGETEKSNPLAINKVTFIESGPIHSSSSLKILQSLPTSGKIAVKSTVPGSHSLDLENQGRGQVKGNSEELPLMEENSAKYLSNSAKENDGSDADRTSYKCLPCNKVFSRRKTYQNHMCTFHKADNDEKANTPRTDSSMAQRKRSAQDKDDEYNSDNEPLQKLRKRRSTDSSKSPVSLCTEYNNTDSIPSQKLRRLSAIAPTIGANHAGSNLRSRSLSEDKTSRIVTDVSGEFSQNPNSVPLATTTAIISSVIKSDSSSAPQREKVTALTQNFVLRRLSGDNPRSSAVTMLRPIIKVQLKNSAVAAKAITNQTNSSSQTKKIAPPRAKSNLNVSDVQFDFAKLVCHTCFKTFPSTPDLKNHLLSIHSFSEEQARTSCYDLAPVSVEAQQDGLEYGYDINQAKCLLCSRHYFSREILYKHLSRFHHFQDSLLAGLKASFNPIVEKKNVKNGNTAPKIVQKSSVKQDTATAGSLLKKLSVPAATEPVKETSTGAHTNGTSPDRMLNSSGESPDFVLFYSKKLAMAALKKFPKAYVNVPGLRCIKCKHRYHKAWDLKMHLIRHLKIGLFACRYCKGDADQKPTIPRSADLMKHLSTEHNIRVTARNRSKYLSECRVNLTNLWEAYGLPLGKI